MNAGRGPQQHASRKRPKRRTASDARRAARRAAERATAPVVAEGGAGEGGAGELEHAAATVQLNLRNTPYRGTTTNWDGFLPLTAPTKKTGAPRQGRPSETRRTSAPSTAVSGK